MSGEGLVELSEEKKSWKGRSNSSEKEEPREHELSEDCWCSPYVEMVEPKEL